MRVLHRPSNVALEEGGPQLQGHAMQPGDAC